MLQVEGDCPLVFCETNTALKITTIVNASSSLAPVHRKSRLRAGFRSLKFRIFSASSIALRQKNHRDHGISAVLAASQSRVVDDLEVSGLRETHASRRISNRICVSAHRMDRSSPPHLSCEQAIHSLAERLTGRQRELVGDRRRCAAVALVNLSADRVVLPAETDSRCALDDDGDRERGERRAVAQAECLLVKPGTAGIDYRSNSDATCAPTRIVDGQID
jgi:hypothetical protein